MSAYQANRRHRCHCHSRFLQPKTRITQTLFSHKNSSYVGMGGDSGRGDGGDTSPQ